MGPQPSKITDSLSQKYQTLQSAFADLVTVATQLHGSLDIQDASKRGLFNSLSRIVAFSDHIHVAMNLMEEDVRAIDAAYGDSSLEGWEDLDEHFDEWFTNLSVSNVKIH